MAARPAPSDVARDTIRQLAARRLTPTPENYSRVYHELAGTRPGAEGAGEPELQQLLRENLVRVLTDAVVPRLGYKDDLAQEARAIAEGFGGARDAAAVRDQAATLRQFWIHLEQRGETLADLLGSALALLQLAVRNFEAVALMMIEAGERGDAAREEGEAARDQHCSCATGFHGRNQRLCARIEAHLAVIDALELGNGQAFEKRHALGERALEFDLAAHRALGDGGNLGLEANRIGQLVDAFAGDDG